MSRRTSADASGNRNLLRLAAVCAAALAVSAVIVALAQSGGEATTPENKVVFGKDTFPVSGPAVFFVRDSDLQSTPRCLASWTELTANVGEAAVWNLISGAPEAGVHEITDSSGMDSCGYDTDTPANTPLTGLDAQPSVEVYIPSEDDWLPHLTDAYDPAAGTFSLANDVNASSTVEAVFSYHVVDTYAVGARRVKVVSSSDPDGEWVGLSEVKAEDDQTSSASSGLFRGVVPLSDDPDHAGTGDHKVFIHPPDTLTVQYFSAEAVLIDSDTAAVKLGEGDACDCPIR